MHQQKSTFIGCSLHFNDTKPLLEQALMNYSARPLTFINKACCVVVKYMRVSHHVPVYAIFLGFPYGFPGCTGLYTGFMVEDSLFLLREREREKQAWTNTIICLNKWRQNTHTLKHTTRPTFVGPIYIYSHKVQHTFPEYHKNSSQWPFLPCFEELCLTSESDHVLDETLCF